MVKTALAILVSLSIPAAVAAPPGATASSPAPKHMLVVCSPGSPGNTLQAQPTMDAFAHAVEADAGWPPASLGASYFETTEAGLARLTRPDAGLAMVPLPFLLRYGNELSLTPVLEARPDSAETEVWSLVAKKGSLSAASSLAGWEVTGTPGYAADFVRGAVLGGWGAVPPDATITFTPRPLSGLRRAAAGEKVAVLLDRAQTAALSSLPFAGNLSIVYSSKPLPSGFLCTVARRMTADDVQTLSRVLLHLDDTDAGRGVLTSLRMKRFAAVDARAIEAVREQIAAVGPHR